MWGGGVAIGLRVPDRAGLLKWQHELCVKIYLPSTHLASRVRVRAGLEDGVGECYNRVQGRGHFPHVAPTLPRPLSAGGGLIEDFHVKVEKSHAFVLGLELGEELVQRLTDRGVHLG